jgi:hypothetical protein
MKPLITSVLIALSLAFGFAGAESNTSTGPKELDRLIDDLDSPSFRVREAASKQLLALEAKAVEPLRRAAAGGKSLELVARAQQLLRKLAIFEPGGKVVSGLKLVLKADREAVKLGDTLILTTSLCNMTDKDMNVMVALSDLPHNFAGGGALRNVVPPAGGKGAAAEMDLHLIESGGLGAEVRLHGIHRTVPARSAVMYNTHATLMRQNGDLRYHLADKAVAYLKVSDKGEHTLRMVFEGMTPRPDDPVRGIRLSVPEIIGTGTARFWEGTVRSNDVRVRLIS